MTRVLPLRPVGALTLAAALSATGCGAAYFGSAVAIFASQKKTKTIVTTSPDPAIAAIEAPTLATMEIGTEVVRDSEGRSGLALTSVRFPSGAGESRSDRGAAESTDAGEELVIALNGDDAQRITLAASSTGAAVAADIEAKVRALTPGAAIPAEAYTRFTCTFDAATRQYVLRSGAPGDDSAVVVNPTSALPQSSTDPAELTAEALRLGVENGGEERGGAESVAWTIFNHGDDLLPPGTEVRVWLSRSKIVDPDSLLIRREPTSRGVEVATARRFTSVNQAPPSTLIAVTSDGQVLIEPGQYFLVVQVAASGDKISSDNVRSSVTPIQLNAPFGGMPTVGSPAPAPTAALDFAPVSFEVPIAVVAGSETVFPLTLTNEGAAVAAPTPIGVDVVIGTDDAFEAPTELADPTGTVAGFVVNPIDVARSSTLVLDTTGGALTVSVAASTVTATFDPATTTVEALVTGIANNAAASSVLEVVWDGVGAQTTDTLDLLLSAASLTAPTIDLPTAGRLIHRETVTFPATPDLQTRANFVLDVTLPEDARLVALPQRFTTFVRIRPPTASPVQDDSNDMRRAPNYMRVYSRSTATLDNGVLLPTQRSTDFARLEPVTQRPVNTGSILQGQQRVFRFEIPNTGIALNESQLLIIVRTSTFDPHIELLDSTARPIARSDDSALGLGSLLYVPVAANQNQLVFYLVVSNAVIDDSNIGGSGASFDLTISVNARQPGDPSLTQAVAVEQLLSARNVAVDEDPASGNDQNDKLIPFDLAQEKSEVMFVLSGRARVRFRTSPVFNVGVTPIITRFNEGEVPTALQFQAEVDPATLDVVYRPSNGTISTSHVLRPGVYTLTFNSLEGPDARTFLLRLEADYIPDDVN